MIWNSEKSAAVLTALALYAGLGAVTAAGIFIPFVSVFGLFIPVTIILLVAAALFVYWPLVHWPWLGWRIMRHPAGVAFGIALALVPALGAPLVVNAWQMRKATDLGLGRKPRQERVELLPAAPLPAREILIADNHGGEAHCGAYCQALLWSGATDHVLTASHLKGDKLESAKLYTLQPADTCEERDLAPRGGLCPTGRMVDSPRFDTIVWLSYSEYRKDLMLYPEQGGRQGLWQRVEVHDCRSLCTPFMTVYAAEAERLAIPVYPNFPFGIDSGGPFGLRYDVRTFRTWPTEKVLEKAFGLRATGFHPRPAFRGEIAHGGPDLPTSRRAHEAREREQEERNRRYWAEEKARLQVYQDIIAETERKRQEGRRNYDRIMREHPECEWPRIGMGPKYGQYLGCSKLKGKPPGYE